MGGKVQGHADHLLTAETRDQGFVSRGYSLGAVDYIVKPFDPGGAALEGGRLRRSVPQDRQVKQQAAALSETTAS